MLYKSFVYLLLFCISFSIQAQTVLKVAYDTDIQFPYYLGQTSQVLTHNPGAIVELIRLLEGKIPGLKIELVRYPWKRCLRNLKEGYVDAVFNSSFKEERYQFGHYPMKDGVVDVDRRITTMSYYFYKKKETVFSWNGKTVSDTTMNIGAPLGFSIVDDLNKMNLKVIQTHATLSNLQKLLRGMVRVVALQDITGDYYLKHFNQFQGLVKVQPAIKTKPYYLMISHQFKQNNSELSEKIWDELAKLRKEKLANLTAKYLH